MKIGFVFHKDSHFKSVCLTANRLAYQYQFEPIFYSINIQEVPPFSLECKGMDIDAIHLNESNLEVLSECDYAVCCLGGWLLNRVVQTLKNHDTKVISLFPGIVSRYQLDAFITRVNADSVWLNSRADYDLYLKLCKIFGLPDNALLYGMSWVNRDRDINSCLSNTKQPAIFVEQTEILSTDDKKTRFKARLAQIFTDNPEIDFIYKTRENTEDVFFQDLRDYFDDFSNVEVKSELTVDELHYASMYLSISSSALAEGVLADKSCWVIDATLLDEDGLEFYKGSGLILQKTVLANNQGANQSWKAYRLLDPKKSIDIASIKKKTSFYRAKKYSYIKVFVYGMVPFKFFMKQNYYYRLSKSFSYLSK